MEYILILDPGQRNAYPVETSHGFLETYATYELAKADGEEMKKNNDCREYGVYVRCTDERNHII